MSGFELSMNVAREGLYLALLLSAPCVGVAMLVGMMVAMVQAATQIQEQTLSFAPKLIAVALALAALAPWMGGMLVRYFQAILEQIHRVGIQ